ncbi:MAG TPA: hypothetical protein VF941_16700 [Clostridia bacterium]
MNKDKHVLPDDSDTFADRVKREIRHQGRIKTTKTIYGPDNEPLARVDLRRER